MAAKASKQCMVLPDFNSGDTIHLFASLRLILAAKRVMFFFFYTKSGGKNPMNPVKKMTRDSRDFSTKIQVILGACFWAYFALVSGIIGDCLSRARQNRFLDHYQHGN